MNKPLVYFRLGDWSDEPEFEACRKNMETVQQRALIGGGYTVIPRYSALPFYKELEKDVQIVGSKLINTYGQHSYVANMQNWYEDFKDITPKTWFRLSDVKNESKGPFVLKGETNSKKFSWKTHMYAEDFKAAGEVMARLMEDGVIGTQQIMVREYVPLKNYGVMPSGIPISHEFRCFFYKDQLLSKAYYWANEDADPVDDIPEDFLKDVARRGAPNINFWVADVAMTAEGKWIVVELNDGCMSGLSRNDPNVLYKALKDAIR